jgi:arylsulfatase A-like enzyme
MILVDRAGDDRTGHNRTDDRLVGWQDVMPTLLDLAGIEVPDTVDGLSMTGDEKREYLYGECGENDQATRMMHDGRYKLIYYPTGNRMQLFDLEEDPEERRDLSGSSDHTRIVTQLKARLEHELANLDPAWFRDGQLTGLPDREYTLPPNRGLSGQRGLHWPPPPTDPKSSYVP